MEHNKPINPFAQNAHDKAQSAINHATEVRTREAEEARKRHEQAHREARVINDGGVMRCSVCRFPFPPDVKPSLTIVFTEHLFKAHRPGQTSEDVNQAAARVVREATKD